MFTISAKGVYGLTAIVALGARFNERPVQIREIADAHEIPQHYLEQILVILKKGGFVESYRGAQGGYSIAREPRSIRVCDVLEVLEGRLEIVPDQKRDSELGFFWCGLERKIRELLDTTVADLLEEKSRAQHRFIYTI